MAFGVSGITTLFGNRDIRKEMNGALNPTDEFMSRAEMTVELYVTLDGTDSRFDGRRAHKHLTQRKSDDSSYYKRSSRDSKYF